MSKQLIIKLNRQTPEEYLSERIAQQLLKWRKRKVVSYAGTSTGYLTGCHECGSKEHYNCHDVWENNNGHFNPFQKKEDWELVEKYLKQNCLYKDFLEKIWDIHVGVHTNTKKTDESIKIVMDDLTIAHKSMIVIYLLDDKHTREMIKILILVLIFVSISFL